MITENELRLLKNNISIMFASGRLNVCQAAKSLGWVADTEDITADEAFFGLYLRPEETLSRLYRIGAVDAKLLARKCLSWTKHKLLPNRTIQPDRIYTPDFDTLMRRFSGLLGVGDHSIGETFVNICGDILSCGCLYEGCKIDEQEKILRKMLGNVSVKNIIRSGIDNFHKTYLLRLKLGGQAFEIGGEMGRLTASLRGKILWREKTLKCRIHKIRAEKGQLTVQCEIGAPIFALMNNEFAVISVINGLREKTAELHTSCGSWRMYEKTAEFRWFSLSFPAENFRDLRVIIRAGEISVPVEFYAENSSFYTACLNFQGFIADEERFVIEAGRLVSRKIPPNAEKTKNKLLEKTIALKNHRIWLYSDYSSVDADNGYFQFVHDMRKNDGVLRFYICHGDVPEDLSAEEKNKWVKFGSGRHRELFLAAEKIFAAYVDAPDCLFPFSEWEYPLYSGIFQGEIIYLQHGVLHAHIPWRYSPVSRNFHCDKIVVSSDFERKNFISTYNFPEGSLILYGMPRYDIISQRNTKKKRILYAPSWRAYMSDCDIQKFREQICSLLDSAALETFLQANDLLLDFKPHPMLAEKFKDIRIKNNRVRSVQNAAAEDYIVFITDFSSYVFDFVYLKTPVVYYFPDINEFVKGSYQYRELDIPFNKGFGRLCLTAGETVSELWKIAENGFKATEEFSSRMDNFFIPLNGCREKLYRFSL